ncbi:TonB-dependent receptor [Pseudoalteromonas sp. McH1-7]|uniref:TonB-dependent receptor n=1 Tax=unclassified Pseudoalteromonas TaxID=194690 RepID=UPI000FFEBA05|nr:MULTISPECIES: TonB-dependent receptor [unclassified Pseudoalteromonas]NUZ11271.1 TonB-dependent receptor [Pseudoalteromonas sp. McH1-7]RXE98399.1 TonB-dependent receptor [Pseudoalteromonas sp. PS5]
MSKLHPSLVALAVSSSFFVVNQSHAEERKIQEKSIERIQVTATRRAGTVQEAPLNITAVDSDVMSDQNIGDLEDVARWVPGLTMTEQGGREGSPIIVRGLNTNSSERASDSGTVATYLGEIPINVDLRLTDIERVEVLIGPQGTLYGAGTLGGAIRTMLKAPVLDIIEGKLSGDVFSINESDSNGHEIGAVFNMPLVIDELAVRASINRYHNPGFMDYSYVVKQPGVSNPDPDWSNAEDVKANINAVADANDETITTTRVSLRWLVNENIDTTLNYFHQKQENGANSISQYQSLGAQHPLADSIKPYESAYRVLEPNEQEDDLLSLEINADLEFADLVSASGWSSKEQQGQRDQTDLLYDIWPGYADFPSFTALTKDTTDQDTFTQEIRLVSKGDDALNWIAGVYYSKQEISSDDREYTPGLTEFWGDEINNIEQDLEYIALTNATSKESALFGEVGYAFSEDFNITVGARFYRYDVNTKSAAETPLYSGGLPSLEQISFEQVSAKDNGSLFKFNANYTWQDGLLTYFTVSEGFRLGGGNGLESCPETLPEQQIICALPHELSYRPDTTTNYELGLKSTWLNNKLHFNAALFSVDWEDAQISSVTVNGQEIITSNAGSANSTGIELSTRAILSDHWTVYATYSYAKAQLTDDAPALFAVFKEGDYSAEEIALYQPYYDGTDGDRLPGAPKQQFSFGLSYEQEVFDDKMLNVNYGVTAQSDVYTKVGLKADGEVLPGFALSNLSAKLSSEQWAVTLYVDNLFDKFAFTSVRRDKSWAGEAKFAALNKALPEQQRVYGHYVTAPRTIGLKLDYQFEL